jgi:GT2 family glycosyltransferase
MKAQPDIQKRFGEAIGRDRQSELSRRSAAELSERIVDLETQLASTKAVLDEVLQSRGWRLLNRYRQLKRRLGTTRLAALVANLLENRRSNDQQAVYLRWIKFNNEGDAIKQAAAEFWQAAVAAPRVSLLIAADYATTADLQRTVSRLCSQTFINWEALILVRSGLDNSERAHFTDARINRLDIGSNADIGSMVERGLASATGDFVAFINPGDELEPNALHEIGRALLQNPGLDVVYTDEDQLGEAGRRCQPFFKPDWSPEYFLSTGYIGNLTVFRRELLQGTAIRPSKVPDLINVNWMLRCFDKAHGIGHIPKVLYHKRYRNDDSLLPVGGSQDLANTVCDGLARFQPGFEVATTEHQRVCRVRPKIQGRPLVSIIIPTKDNVRMLRRAIRSIEQKTAYRHFEILIVDNNSSGRRTRKYLSSLSHRVLQFDEPFNYSRINNFAAPHASGTYLLFLNDDVKVINSDWLTAMLEYCQLPEIGAVGAKLYYPSGLIQHGGIILGIGGVADNSQRRLPRSSPGYHSSLVAVRNYSAVTAACMMVRREVFDQVRGFNEDLAVAFNDVDFCLRLRKAGLRVVWTPYAELCHYESASRGYEIDFEEIAFMRRHWPVELARDPYYNPNLSLTSADFRLAAAPNLISEEYRRGTVA